MRADEREFLNRLHGDIAELQERRTEYDKSRPEILETLNVITEFLYGEREDLSAAEVLQVQFLPELADFEGLVNLPFAIISNGLMPSLCARMEARNLW